MWTLTALVFAAAALYSSVGHGGASAYLALMALFAIAPAVMRPTALVLNLFVAGIGALRYWGSGRFEWRMFWPFAVTAVPMAFLAGRIDVPPEIYRPLLGLLLVIAAARYLLLPKIDASKTPSRPNLVLALATGAGLGALAGLTGTGGGIFLSPLLIFFGWADAFHTAGIAAAFIVVNSVAGLAGQLSSFARLPNELPYFAGAAVLGAVVGTTLNLRWFSREMLLRALGLVLLVAGARLMMD